MLRYAYYIARLVHCLVSVATMVIGCCVMHITLRVLFIVAFLLQHWLLDVALCILHCASCSLLHFCFNNGYWMLRYAYYIARLVHCCVSVSTMVIGCCVMRTYSACLVPHMLVFTARYELFRVILVFEV